MKHFAGKMTLALALLFAVSVAFSGSAVAQYNADDDYYQRWKCPAGTNTDTRVAIKTDTARGGTKDGKTILAIST